MKKLFTGKIVYRSLVPSKKTASNLLCGIKCLEKHPGSDCQMITKFNIRITPIMDICLICPLANIQFKLAHICSHKMAYHANREHDGLYELLEKEPLLNEFRLFSSAENSCY